MNTNLKNAKKNKNDEFYTRLADIENEVKHYKPHFEGKIVYCNCDDPEWSNFFIYFRDNFKHLKLQKLISTHYTTDATNDKAYKLECVEISNENGIPVEKKTFLQGDGDFRSEECIALLKESDIVCTNPPFSLFREYVDQLIKHNKQFLIIGSQNAITYKAVFNFIRGNILWLGVSKPKEFMQPNQTIKVFGNICWYTNLQHKRRNEKLLLWKDYDEKEHPNYDNYDAIDVPKVAEIPSNFDGYMGVPITFLDKYNPEQFDILGIMNTGEENIGIRLQNTKHGRPVVNGVEKYLRIIIKRKNNEN